MALIDSAIGYFTYSSSIQVEKCLHTNHCIWLFLTFLSNFPFFVVVAVVIVFFFGIGVLVYTVNSFFCNLLTVTYWHQLSRNRCTSYHNEIITAGVVGGDSSIREVKVV